jgi:hypothetical protein
VPQTKNIFYLALSKKKGAEPWHRPVVRVKSDLPSVPLFFSLLHSKGRNTHLEFESTVKQKEPVKI